MKPGTLRLAQARGGPVRTFGGSRCRRFKRRFAAQKNYGTLLPRSGGFGPKVSTFGRFVRSREGGGLNHSERVGINWPRTPQKKP